MTDQELKGALTQMPRKDFEKMLHEHNLSLIVDTQGIGGYGDPMYYVESMWSVPIHSRQAPSALGWLTCVGS